MHSECKKNQLNVYYFILMLKITNNYRTSELLKKKEKKSLKIPKLLKMSYQGGNFTVLLKCLRK